MPKLPGFNLQPGAPGPGPQVQPADTTGLAQGIADAGKAAKGIADIVIQRKEQNEKMELDSDLGQLHVEYNKRLAEVVAKADPNDKEVMNRFMEEYRQAAEPIINKPMTRAGSIHAKRYYNETVRGFAETGRKKLAHMSGERAELSATQTLNSLTSLVMTDPSKRDFALAKWSEHAGLTAQQMDIASPGSSAQFRQGGIDAINAASIRGDAQNNPYKTLKDLQQGAYDSLGLSGKEKATLMRYAKTEISYKEAEEARRKRYLADKKDADEEATMLALTDKYLEANVMGGKGPDGKPLPPMTVADIRAAKVSDDKKRTLLNMLNKKNANAMNNPQVFRGLLERILLPDGDPDKLTDFKEVTRSLTEGLDPSHYRLLKSIFNKSGTAEGKLQRIQFNSFLTAAKDKILEPKTNAMGAITSFGKTKKHTANYALFTQAFAAEYLRLTDEEGVPANQVLNPNSQHYLGYLIDQFRVKDIGGFGREPADPLAPRFGPFPEKKKQKTESKKESKSMEGMSDDEKTNQILMEELGG